MKYNNISTIQLAKICGVSQGTVDRALNNRNGISIKTKERILKTAKEYGYRPNIHASSMAGGKSMTLGVVVFDLNNQYFTELTENIEKAAALLNYSITVMFSNKDTKREIDIIKNLYSMSVDGIVICPINKGEEFENFLLALKIPVVTVGNKLNNFSYVGIDNYKAMKDVLKTVLSKKYQKIICVAPYLPSELNSYAQNERIRAFKEILSKTTVDFAVTRIKNAKKYFSEHKKTVFVCTTDLYALELYNFAKANSLGLIGFDNIRLIDVMGLELDSVSYDIEAAGQTIVNYLTGKNTEIPEISYKIINRGSL